MAGGRGAKEGKGSAGQQRCALQLSTLSQPLKAREQVINLPPIWVRIASQDQPLAVVRSMSGGCPTIHQNSPVPRAGGCPQCTSSGDRDVGYRAAAGGTRWSRPKQSRERGGKEKGAPRGAPLVSPVNRGRETGGASQHCKSMGKGRGRVLAMQPRCM